MSDASIKIDGMEELLAKIKTLQELKPVIAAMKAAAVYVKGKAAEYPERKTIARASVYGTPFKTIKQRRWFFWALKNDKIEVPYNRGSSPGSEAFGRRWTVSAQNNGLTQVVGNNADYGPYLMDPQKQSAYSKAMGWQTTQVIVDETAPVVKEFLQEYIDRYLKE